MEAHTRGLVLKFFDDSDKASEETVCTKSDVPLFFQIPGILLRPFGCCLFSSFEEEISNAEKNSSIIEINGCVVTNPSFMPQNDSFFLRCERNIALVNYFYQISRDSTYQKDMVT